MNVSNKILSDITVYMKYAKYLPEHNRRETWEELVTRNMNMHLKKYPELNESLEAVALDSDENEIFKIAISELVPKITGQSGIKYLILDGIITQRLFDAAKNAGIEHVIGHRMAKLSNTDGVSLKTFRELGIA